ncbi:ATP-binding protein [Variovorax paradoxus]|uniref:ATP-binding protein n=1 Tax=Variovorax paradoxus TaxID=34073 RepID=UPI0009BA7E5E|nr:ATP-binding protein [Variovorax paradoxus]
MHSLASSWSLRHRVAAIALFVCTATLLAGGLAMHRADIISDRNVLDARLVTLARTVLAFAEHEIEEEGFIEGLSDVVKQTESSLDARYHYRIWSVEGRLLHQSHKGRQADPVQPIAQRGFGETVVDGEEVRTYTHVAAKTGMVIQIAERQSDREAAAGITTGYFLSFLAIPLLLIFVSTWWFVNQALRSVEGYASQLRERHALDLSELKVANPPIELKPMVDSINGVFARFRSVLSSEREFTAIAAHEMRTPLAGLRAHAQLATAVAASPQELSSSLRGLMSGIDEASYLLDQLLDLARVDSLAVVGHVAVDVNLQKVFQDVMSELGPVAAHSQVTVATRLEVSRLPAVELGLHMLMHNLLDNAIRFTPAGGRIEIGSLPVREGVLLTFDDSGPGIPASQHAAAFQRFNRLGRVDPHGVGLGLSIVKAVALAHHAEVRLQKSPLGGLRVEITFPVPCDTAAETDERPAKSQGLTFVVQPGATWK